jgi:hypothetical protein
MNAPNLLPAQIAHISGLVAQYIRAQQDAYRAAAVPLTDGQRMTMAGFFPDTILQTARLCVLRGARVANPDFYPALQQMGFRNLINFDQMAAITFENVVVSHEELTDQLLFHELVHVEQYRQLGIDRFAQLYVQGFLTGGGYDGIPLEMQAYALDARFHRAPATRFDVTSEIAEAIRADRL